MTIKTIQIPLDIIKKKDKKKLDSIFHFLQLECQKLLSPPICGIVITLKNTLNILHIRHSSIRLIIKQKQSITDYLFHLSELQLYKNGTQINKALWPTFIEKLLEFNAPLLEQKVDIYDEIYWPNHSDTSSTTLKPRPLSIDESHLVFAGMELTQFYDIAQYHQDIQATKEQYDNHQNIKNLLKHSSNPINTTIYKQTRLTPYPNIHFSQPDYYNSITIWLYSFIKTFNRFLHNVDTTSETSENITHFIIKHEKIIFEDLKYSKIKPEDSQRIENEIINSYHSKLTTYINSLPETDIIAFLTELNSNLPKKGFLKGFTFKKICKNILKRNAMSANDLIKLRKHVAHHFFTIELPFIKLNLNSIYNSLLNLHQLSTDTEKKPSIKKQNSKDKIENEQISQFIHDDEQLHRIFFSITSFLTRLVLFTQLSEHNCRNEVYNFNSILPENISISTNSQINAIEKWQNDFSFLDPTIIDLTILSNCLKESCLILESLICAQKLITNELTEKIYIQSAIKLVSTYKPKHCIDTLVSLGLLQIGLEINSEKNIEALLIKQMIDLLKQNNKTKLISLDLIKILCKQTSSELKLHIKNSQSNLFEFLINNGKYCIHHISQNRHLNYETSQTGININETKELPL